MLTLGEIVSKLPAKYDVAEDPEFLEIRVAGENDNYSAVRGVIVTPWEGDLDSGRVVGMYYPRGFELFAEADSIVTRNLDRFLAFLERNLG